MATQKTVLSADKWTGWEDEVKKLNLALHDLAQDYEELEAHREAGQDIIREMEEEYGAKEDEYNKLEIMYSELKSAISDLKDRLKDV